MTLQITKAQQFRDLHVPGAPLILTNVWDAVSARIVAETPGVKAVASASHSVSYAHGLPDGEGLSLDLALSAAREIVGATDLPVTIDFERGYAADAEGVEMSVARLIDTGAVGLNLEDTTGDRTLFALGEATDRVAAAVSAGRTAGIPIVVNARVDALVRGSDWADARARANAYLAAGADVAFILGLSTEDDIRRAIDEVDGRVSVIAGHGSVPLARLAELGVSRVSFGPGILGLALSSVRDAAAGLTALGDYPAELAFDY